MRNWFLRIVNDEILHCGMLFLADRNLTISSFYRNSVEKKLYTLYMRSFEFTGILNIRYFSTNN